MSFLSKLFGKKDASQIETVPEKVSLTVTGNVSYSTEIPSLQGDYAKTVFLWAHDKASPVRKQDEYARYFLYECGIRNPVTYHKELIAQGYFAQAPVTAILKTLKVAELKQLLAQKGKPTTGKKEVLIERISETASKELVDQLCADKLYFLSEKGQIFLSEHQNYVLVHKHKANWGIDWHEFDANYRPGLSFYDVAWSIFNRRVVTDKNTFGRNEYLHMYQLLVEEGKRERAFEILLRVMYIDLSGVCASGSYQLYREGIYSKKDLREHFGIAIMLAPGIVNPIADFADLYDDAIIDRLYEQKLPMQVCDKKLFRSIVLSIFDGTYDESKVEEQLKRAYYKVINAL